MPKSQISNFKSQIVSRRTALKTTACSFAHLAFASTLARSATHSTPTHLAPRAKRIIFLFMQGGPSQIDTFDYKPELYKKHDQTLDLYNARQRKVQKEKLLKPFWDFQQHGQSGRNVSSLFPHVAKHVDDLCFIHSMHTEGVAHGPATIFLHTGATSLIRPSLGSWISYGLGSENENMPAFVTVNPPATKGGPRNYGTAFLPSLHQGTVLGTPGNPNAHPAIKHLQGQTDPAAQQRAHNFLQQLNQHQAGRSSSELDAALNSMELAWRMQMKAPNVVNIEAESKQTHDLYGIGHEPTDGFGRQCLAARQLAENNVRFIQISHCDNSPTPVWDQHNNMPKHADRAAEVDKPIAGLLTDLKRRGLLEDTLVWWGAEFGRTPFTQNKNGRDHNPRGFTTWLAGGGVKPGHAHGSTDELGYQAVEDKVHMHDLHATILHLMGLDHERLTYRHAGRNFRLTDVHGEVVKQIIA